MAVILKRVSRTTPRRRTAWACQYIDAIIQSNVRDVAGIARIDPLPLLLRALAHVSGQIYNYIELGGQVVKPIAGKLC